MVNASTGNGVAIEVRGLTKRYGKLTAVDGISFEVMKGEFFGFLGPNGAGKTTSIRMLTGIISESDGEARVMGYPAGSIESKQLSGVVPEQSNVYMDLTAWQNLMLTADLYRIPPSEASDSSDGPIIINGFIVNELPGINKRRCWYAKKGSSEKNGCIKPADCFIHIRGCVGRFCRGVKIGRCVRRKNRNCCCRERGRPQFVLSHI